MPPTVAKAHNWYTTHKKGKKKKSNSRESSIQTLHIDLECSTAQYTFKFKSISAGLTRYIKEPNKKDSNSLNASLFTILAHVSDMFKWE